MSYQAIINELQTLVGALPSITLAPLAMQYPQSINANTMLPFAFSWPSEPSWDTAALGLDRDETVFTLVVLVAPITNTAIDGLAYSLCITVLDDLRDLFRDLGTQDLNGTVEQIGVVQGQALADPVAYGDGLYWAIRLTFPIILKETP